jgi:adenylyl-sulfate kinase
VREATGAAVLWFTGLSGAGKSTIASRLYRRLTAAGTPTEYVDGDVLRAVAPTGFSRAERDAHVLTVGYFASRLERRGVNVVCALISPYAEARARVRRLCGRFIEIYVATPLEVCERRDVKGLYARARSGAIVGFTGIDAPYEAPRHADVVIDTRVDSIDGAVDRIIEAWSADRVEAGSP